MGYFFYLIGEASMRKYKIFLKSALIMNLLFVVVVAVLGYRKEQSENTNKVYETVALSKGSRDSDASCMVTPVGKTVGIYVNTAGILVIDTGEVINIEGEKETPAKNRLMPGDYITQLNGKVMRTKKQLIDAITNCDGRTLVFEVRRKDEAIEVKIEPIETSVGEYKIGIWVRDDMQGLGTITYIDGEKFGALGHSINDMDTGKVLEVSHGEIYEADIFGVEKGAVGTPGVIEGMIAYQTENVVGDIAGNDIYGIFGNVKGSYKDSMCEEKLPVANVEDVELGTAYIQSYVSGEKELYKIEIENLHKNENKDMEMEIRVTDKRLIDLTGGIVQGMSGSPVLQNGRIVGAVTHVFVDDPTRGYAIFIEEMLEDN